MTGTYQEFLEALSGRESNGVYTVENSFGFLGKYQMGELALIDAGYYTADGTGGNTQDWVGTWTGKDGINSKSDFLNSPTAQENAIRAYEAKTWGYIQNKGMDVYEGQVINGHQITVAGLLAGYHLKGLGTDSHPGLIAYLKSGGDIDPVDGYGTHISEYINSFSDYGTPFMVNHNGNDTLTGGSGEDMLFGAGGADRLSGGGGVDTLDGGIGSDWLDGGDNSDIIYGGADADVLFGGKGNDFLYGGNGQDIYVVTLGGSADGVQHDLIRDVDGLGNLNVITPNVSMVFSDIMASYDSAQDLWTYAAPGGLTVTFTLRGDDLVVQLDEYNYVTIKDFAGSSEMALLGTKWMGITLQAPGGGSGGGDTGPVGDGDTDGPGTGDAPGPGTGPNPDAEPPSDEPGYNPGADPYDPDGNTPPAVAGLDPAIGGGRDKFDNALESAEPRRADPLVLDLNHDGLELAPLSGSSFFDLDASGINDRIGWVMGGDGLLVLDRDHSGSIEDGSELYGSATPKWDLICWPMMRRFTAMATAS